MEPASDPFTGSLGRAGAQHAPDDARGTDAAWGLPQTPTGAAEAQPEATFRYWSPGLLLLIPCWITVAALLLPDPESALRECWPLFFVGIAGAVIGNITAVGGGLVFVPFTMLVWGMDALTSLALAIGCQTAGMTSGAIAWWRRGRVPVAAFRSILPWILVGCAIGGLVIRPDAGMVKGLFGPVSCAIGIYILAMLNRSPEGTEVKSTVGLRAMAGLGAVLTAWVAIGIGEALAAFLMLRHRVCAERAIALGVAALSASSICLFAIFSFSMQMPWAEISVTALACILGGRLAPILSTRISQRTVKLIFGSVALADGLMFIYFYGI